MNAVTDIPPTAVSPAPETHSYWWTWLVAGVVTIGVGVLVLFKPGGSLKALAVITGIYFLLDSVLAFASALSSRTENQGFAALHGILSLVIGLILVRHPLQSVEAIAILIGIWLLAVGSVSFVSAFHFAERRFLHMAVALIPFLAGIVIIANPKIGYGTLALVAGIALVVQGLGMVALSLALRKE